MPRIFYRLAVNVGLLAEVPGWLEYRQGKLDEALFLLENETEINCENGAAWELLGLTYRDKDRLADAADALERAALLKPSLPLSRLVLAECYASMKRYRLAQELYLMLAESSPEDFQLLLLVASGLDEINQPHLALQLCRRAEALRPESGQSAFDMCYYSMRSGCPVSLSESLAWRAVELEPDNLHFRIGLASLLCRLDEVPRAIWVLSKLSDGNLRQLECTKCLDRLAKLFRLLGDAQKSSLCLNRLEQLAGKTEPLTDFSRPQTLPWKVES
jgi:tetratricopeptide (TPR) repeat protein